MYPFKKGLFSLNSNMNAVKLAALEAGNFHLATKAVGQEAFVEALEMTMKRLSSPVPTDVGRRVLTDPFWAII